MTQRPEANASVWMRRRFAASARAVLLSVAWLGLVPPASFGALQTEQRPGARAARPVSTAPAGDRTLEYTAEGVRVSLEVHPAADATGKPRQLEDVAISFEIADAATGRPLGAAQPAAWIDLRSDETPTSAEVCGDKIARYVRGTLKFRPEVDLNSYYVLALTRGPQIAVIDPMLGFGNSKLYTTVLLPGPGADWASSPDERTVYVSIPKKGQVSLVDTDTWKVSESVDAGVAPTRLRLGPDGRHLWVTNDAEGEDGGVTVIDLESRSVAARIATGGGAHALAFVDEGRRVFVTNAEAGTVTVIDAKTLERVADLETGGRPVDLAYSSVLGSVFVIDEAEGSIVAINASTLDVLGRDHLEPGLNAIRLIPEAAMAGHGHGHGGANPLAGRIAFITNGREDLTHVYDVVNGRLLRTVAVFENPDQIAFSSSFAYIRSAGSAEVTMVPLNDPTSGGVGAFDHFPAGSAVPGLADAVSAASAIVQAPDMPDAIFVANAGEKAIYYYHYMEGMPTPSGSLSTYGFVPTGVMLVGRRLRETGPGRYTATVRLDQPGEYDVVFLLPEPRIVHCFPFTVLENPDVGGERVALRLRPLDGLTMPVAGEARLRFRLYDAFTNEPQPGVEDLTFMLASPSGWKRRVAAEPLGGGEYALRVSVPAAGVYYLSFEIPSRNITLRDRPPLVLRASTDDTRTTR